MTQYCKHFMDMFVQRKDLETKCLVQIPFTFLFDHRLLWWFGNVLVHLFGVKIKILCTITHYAQSLSQTSASEVKLFWP